MGDASDAVQTTRTSGNSALDPTRPAGLRTRYGRAVAFSQTHNRHRDWQEGNHSGYALARWLADHADEVRWYNAFEVKWANNASERVIKDPERHRTASGYWYIRQTLGRFCRIRSYLAPARNHGVGVIDAATPPLPETLALHRNRSLITQRHLRELTRNSLRYSGDLATFLLHRD